MPEEIDFLKKGIIKKNGQEFTEHVGKLSCDLLLFFASIFLF